MITSNGTIKNSADDQHRPGNFKNYSLSKKYEHTHSFSLNNDKLLSSNKKSLSMQLI